MPRVKTDENKQITMETAQRIRAVRERMGYTQEGAAELAGLSVENYKKIEEGSNAMSIYSLRRIQEAFEVTFDYILLGATDEKADLWQHVNTTDFNTRIMIFAKLLKQLSDYDVYSAIIYEGK